MANMQQLQIGRVVRLSEPILGNQKNDAGVSVPITLPAGSIVTISGYKIQSRPTTANSLSQPIQEFIYSFQKDEGRKYMEGYKRGEMVESYGTVSHLKISLTPGGPVPKAFVEATRIVYLLENINYTDRDGAVAQFMAGTRIMITSNLRKTVENGRNTNPQDVMYFFQNVERIEGPIIWESDHYYPLSAFTI